MNDSQLPSFDVIIPARYASTRLPGKALLDIAGRPLICHTIDCARQSAAQTITVATDDERIKDVVESYGANCVLTDVRLPSGTDRLAQAAKTLALPESRIVVNLQGDEPEMPATLINDVARALAQDRLAVMSTAATPLLEWSLFVDPACVKVVINADQRAIFFSRAPIPWPRDSAVDKQIPGQCMRHVGLYAYRVRYLDAFTQRGACELEMTEQLEQLRALHYGEWVSVVTADEVPPVGIDTAHDLEQARLRMQ